MIDGLVTGKIYGTPKRLQGKSGKFFATAKVKVTAGGEQIFANVIVFNEDVIAQLLALGQGDSISVSGDLTPKVWTDKEGVGRPTIDITGHAILTPHHVSRRRQAMTMAQRPGDRGQPQTDDRGEWGGDGGA